MTLRVAHISSEVVPFSKTGGLADVVGALAPALARLGLEVTVVAPAHRSSTADGVPGEPAFEIEAMGYRATVHRVSRDGVNFLLLDCPPIFVRPALYALPDGEFPDNPIRYTFFSRAALAALARAGGTDVVHAHDWQAALVPLLLRRELVVADALATARTVLTVHNLAYQGVFPPWVLDACDLPRSLFSTPVLEFYGNVSFLKGGLVSADAVSTVSPTYAREILDSRFGCGLEGVLASRRNDLIGILNGLDTATWDPGNDPHLPRRYDPSSVTAGKAAAKTALGTETGTGAAERPLAGMVSRLAEQKGADIVAATLDRLLQRSWDVVVLGTGERRFEELLRSAEAAHPGRVRLLARFDERLAHLIYAAADVFLMPSRYEPCGLGQMIAMRYGTIPLVTPTGGLADTVVDLADRQGTGVVLHELSATGLLEGMGRVEALLADPRTLLRVRRRAMARDFTWDASARRYSELYEKLLAARSG